MFVSFIFDASIVGMYMLKYISMIILSCLKYNDME
ncbi:hypothetical protein BACOVA_03039 [Bacteroides ovatus ATCC 8483]|uniref:Uncharacterized protein n=1 Tax=Bacteroides ovatus (strain ATCC 8483 / DSM 1896 / JCM 5824 / BCRC 10623 / CCUG 4943 / NCTC 11153) TaxID=411476 RepID=A0AAN3D7M3_BACO1|nr:hypothetical protein BACOVA_03039 [Bacteroides ovatus ATCC 8483]